MALNLPERICKWFKCRSPFKPKRRNQDFCKPSCREAYHNYLKLTPDATCPHCGKPIFPEEVR